MYSKIALTIGGSDSGGGAGIQADLRTFMALKVHGCSVITCITAQNSIEVTCVEAVDQNTLLGQLDTLFSDFGINWQVRCNDGEFLWLFYAHGAQLPGGWFCHGKFG